MQQQPLVFTHWGCLLNLKILEIRSGLGRARQEGTSWEFFVHQEEGGGPLESGFRGSGPHRQERRKRESERDETRFP